MKGYKQVSEAEFKRVRALFDAGCATTLVKKVNPRSDQVLMFMKQANSVSDYRKLIKAWSAGIKEKRLAQEKKESQIPPMPPMQTDPKTPEMPIVDTSIEGQLKGLNKKLDMILHQQQHLSNVIVALQNTVVAGRKFRIF